MMMALAIDEQFTSLSSSITPLWYTMVAWMNRCIVASPRAEKGTAAGVRSRPAIIDVSTSLLNVFFGCVYF